MIVGVPREIKEGEERVALTPAGAKALSAAGHKVLVEPGAGEFAGFHDDHYAASGAVVSGGADEVWEGASLVLKVKEPLPPEFSYLRADLTVFSFLHLAANPALAVELKRTGATAIAYETVQLDDGSLPLLSPMSEVAGCIAVQNGAYFLEARNGGRGVLLPGISGSPPGRVTIIGCGVAGITACRQARGIGADVTVFDASIKRLDYVRDVFAGGVSTILSSPASIEECIPESDLVIGAVLIPGQKAPLLLTRQMIESMRRGTVFIDISIDQGGISETGRVTTHEDPFFVEAGVLHSCIPNIPAAVPRSSSLALAARSLPYALEMAEKGMERALDEDEALMRGVNVRGGKIVHPGVREALGD